MAIVSRFHYQFDGVPYPPGAVIPAYVAEAHQPKLVSESAEAEGEAGEPSLSDRTVPELKDLAKGLEIEGYSSMVKADLIEAIEAARE